MDIKLTYHTQWLDKKAQEDKAAANAKIFKSIKLFCDQILQKPLSGNFLDLGCGDGSFFNYAITQGIKAQGIDITDGVDFEKDKLPLESASFDFVMMYSVIEHIFDPSNIITEAKRVLKPDGILFFITPNIDYCGSRFYDDHTHIRPYNATGLTRLMRAFGFKKSFTGLWVAGKSAGFWRLPEGLQYFLGKYLPFTGRSKYAPSFLKGKSSTLLAAYSIKAQ